MALYQKVYFLLVIFTIIVYTQQQIKDPEFKAKWDQFRVDCAAEEKMDLDEANKAWTDNNFPEDPKLKCFYKCTSTKLGILDAAGEVVDGALGDYASHFSDSATKAEIVEECGHLNGTDLCDTAYALTKCMKAALLD